MELIKSITISEIRSFEEKINGNVRIGGYDMEQIAPIEEGKLSQIALSNEDLNRLYLLKEPTFKDFTKTGDYKLENIIPEVCREKQRVKYWIDQNIDLSINNDWAPVLISNSFESGKIVIIDGNHRATAHFIQHKSINGAFAYLFEHHNVYNWGMF